MCIIIMLSVPSYSPTAMREGWSGCMSRHSTPTLTGYTYLEGERGDRKMRERGERGEGGWERGGEG